MVGKQFFIPMLLIVFLFLGTSSISARVYISEFLPDPSDEGDVGEWIELHNDSDSGVLLVGYSLDDAEGGSAPYDLSHVAIVAGGYAVVSKEVSGIALNNAGDQVRLLYDDDVIDEVQYDSGIKEDYTYQWTGESWEQTPVATKGYAYVKPEPTLAELTTIELEDEEPSVLVAQELILSEVMACPLTGEREWVELYNPTHVPVLVDGWTLRDMGSTSQELSGIVEDQGYLLVAFANHWMNNAGDSVVLVDPNGHERSGLSYETCSKGFAYIPSDTGWQQTLIQTPGVANVLDPFPTPTHKTDQPQPTLKPASSPSLKPSQATPTVREPLVADVSFYVATASGESVMPEGSVAGIVDMVGAEIHTTQSQDDTRLDSQISHQLYPPLYLTAGLFYAGYGYLLLNKSNTYANA